MHRLSNNLFWRWAFATLIIAILTYIALGHTGTADDASRLRLIPFESYGWSISCAATRCGGLQTALYFLFINVLGNIVVFMPAGFSLFYAFQPIKPRPALAATLWGALISLSYEIAQIWIPGRVVATDDVIMNAIGAATGALAARVAWRFISTLRTREVIQDQV